MEDWRPSFTTSRQSRLTRSAHPGLNSHLIHCSRSSIHWPVLGVRGHIPIWPVNGTPPLAACEAMGSGRPTLAASVHRVKT